MTCAATPVLHELLSGEFADAKCDNFSYTRRVMGQCKVFHLSTYAWLSLAQQFTPTHGDGRSASDTVSIPPLVLPAVCSLTLS